jgi:hypothetical protein
MVLENNILLRIFLYLFPQLSVFADILITYFKFLGILVFFLCLFFNILIWLVPYLVTALTTNAEKLKNRFFSSLKNKEQSCQFFQENKLKKRGKYNRYSKIESFKTLDDCKEWLKKPVLGQLYVYK